MDPFGSFGVGSVGQRGQGALQELLAIDQNITMEHMPE